MPLCCNPLKKNPHKHVKYNQLRIISHEMSEKYPCIIKDQHICTTCRTQLKENTEATTKHLPASCMTDEAWEKLESPPMVVCEEENLLSVIDCCEVEKIEEEGRCFEKIKAIAAILDIKVDTKNFKSRLSYQQKIKQRIQSAVDNLFLENDAKHDEENCSVLAKAIVSHRWISYSFISFKNGDRC